MDAVVAAAVVVDVVGAAAVVASMEVGGVRVACVDDGNVGCGSAGRVCGVGVGDGGGVGVDCVGGAGGVSVDCACGNPRCIGSTEAGSTLGRKYHRWSSSGRSRCTNLDAGAGSTRPRLH